MKIPILKEFERFEWFGPSPIEPFNSAEDRELRRAAPRHRERALAEVREDQERVGPQAAAVALQRGTRSSRRVTPSRSAARGCGGSSRRTPGHLS